MTAFIFLALVYSFSGSIEADNCIFVDKTIIVTAIDLFDCVEMLEFNMLPEYELSGALRHTITAFAILLFLSSVIALFGLRKGVEENGFADCIVSLIGLIVNAVFMGVRFYVATKSDHGISIFAAKNAFFAVIDIIELLRFCDCCHCWDRDTKYV